METLAYGLTLMVLGVSGIFSLVSIVMILSSDAVITRESIVDLLFYLSMCFTSTIQYKGLQE